MMWDEVMTRVLAKMAANDTLFDLFGDRMAMSSAEAKLEIPSLQYTILTDTNGEVDEPILVQIDVWTLKAEDNRTAERIIRTMFHQRTSIQLDGVTLISDYMDGAFLATPSRAGFIGRGLRFRFAPLVQHLTLPSH